LDNGEVENMSEKSSAWALRAQQQQAMAEVLKGFVPQLFSHPQHLTGGAEDAGGQDQWMLTNMPADVLIPLAGLEIIGQEDKRKEVLDFVDLVLRGLKGVGGFTVKQGERIAIGLGSGTGKKIVKRPGLVGRNITNRDWERKAEEEGAVVEG
jgi:hypothetical protein